VNLGTFSGLASSLSQVTGRKAQNHRKDGIKAMKNKFLILIFITLLLSACSLTSRIGSQNPASGVDHPQTTQAANVPDTAPTATQSMPIPTEVAADAGESQATQPAATGGQRTPDLPAATGQPAATQEPADPTPIQANDSAIVSAGGLNLRIGPGYGYGVIRMLQEGQKVKVLGRSVNGDWIEVMIDEQTGGWVYGRYLDASFDLAALPVKEAYGGPYSQSGQPVSGSSYSLYMSINGRQATINLGRFPAATQIEAFLGRSGESANMLVASGQTNATGAAQLDFNVPDEWQDGAPLSEQELLLVVRSVDGDFSQSATIEYIH
jgi:uncharacterized protein YraI